MKLREFYNPFQKQITPSAGAILALLFFSHPTLAINCPTPAAQFDKDFRLDLKGKGEVGKLLKLGSGEIDAVLESKVHDLFSKYPNADKLVLQNWTMSMICQQLNESTTLSDQEKLQILFQLHQRVGDIFLKKRKHCHNLARFLKAEPHMSEKQL